MLDGYLGFCVGYNTPAASKNVKILVIDTEVNYNTGGQASKVTATTIEPAGRHGRSVAQAARPRSSRRAARHRPGRTLPLVRVQYKNMYAAKVSLLKLRLIKPCNSKFENYATGSIVFFAMM